MDGLWGIKLPVNLDTLNHIIDHIYQAPSQPKISAVIRKHQSKVSLATYHHHTLFAPTEKTLRQAIRNNHFVSWPGLTQSTLSAGLMPSEATAKGHMKQEKNNFQSTKTSVLSDAIDELQHQPPADPNSAGQWPRPGLGTRPEFGLLASARARFTWVTSAISLS